MNRSRREHGRIVGDLMGIVVVSLLVVTVMSGSVAAHTGDDGFHHHDGWMGTHGGTGGWMIGGFGFLWMILWTLVLIGGPVALVFLLLTRRESADGTDDALALLRRRYAQGEIDDEEFESRRARLLTDGD